MKNLKQLIFLLSIILVLGTGCTKDGEMGPAGANGKDGTNGINGTNGVDGADGVDALIVTPEDQAAFDAADGVTGARLYDHVLNQIESNDASLTEMPNFYRCKSCHGWDLLGQRGVLINKTPTSTYPVAAEGNLYAWSQLHNIADVFDAIKNPGGRTKSAETAYNGTMPNYGDILEDADIWNLVKFLKETAHNVNDFYDLSTSGVYPNGTKTFDEIGKDGVAANGKTVYDANCKSCHGADGTGLNIYCKGEYLGDMFREDPHEIQHKTVWGMPIDREHINAGCSDAGAMPAQTITDQDIKDLMVMGQDENAFPGYEMTQAETAYAAADGVKGARLYDHSLNEKGITGTVMNDHSNFFRCKSCHGWDLLGNNGVNVSNVGSDTKPSTAPVDLMEVRANDGILEIFEAIKHMDGRETSGTWNPAQKDVMPNFGQILSDDDVWDLVKFIKETAHDVSDFYDMDISSDTAVFSNIGKNGNAAAGLATYNTNCRGCHGADGSGINIYCKGEWLGNMFRDDPHEIQHKSIWGMPIDAEHIAAGCGEAGMMPAQTITDDDIRNMMVMGQDEVAFPDFH